MYPDLFNGGGIQKNEFTSILLSDLCIERGTRIVELGSTLGASVLKFRIIQDLKQVNAEIRWVGIENSSTLEHLSQSLHDHPIEIVKSYKDLERLQKSHLLARFVSSYVFKGADDFATWIVENFESFVIEDAFSADGDKRIFNHGMPEVFMDFITLQKILLDNKFFLYIENMYFDYPSNTSQCINMRIIGTKDANFLQKYQELYGLNTLFVCDANEPYKFLSKLPVDKSYLKNVKHNKSVNPIWAETPTNYSRYQQRFLYLLNRFKIRAYRSAVRTGPHIARTLREYLDRM